MKKLFLIALLTLTSCSSYKWVDMEDCKERIQNLGKCREVK